MNRMCMQVLAHDELDKLLRPPVRKKRRLLIQGYHPADKRLYAKLYLDSQLPRELQFGAFKNVLQAEEFVRHLKNYSLHTDLQVMQLSSLSGRS